MAKVIRLSHDDVKARDLAVCLSDSSAEPCYPATYIYEHKTTHRLEEDCGHCKHSLKTISVYNCSSYRSSQLSVVFRINPETVSVYFCFAKSLIFQIIKELQNKL